MSPSRISALTLTCLLSTGIAFGGPAASLNWQDLFSGMRFERERLISGVYSASGTEMPLGIDHPVPFRLYGAFSFAEQKIRFEHRSRASVRRNNQLVEEDTHRVICLLPDRAYHFSDLSSSLMLNIVPPGTLRLPHRDGTRGFLDPRCLGLITIDKMYNGIPFEDAVEELSSTLTGKVTRISDEGDGVVRVEIVGRGGRTSLWIDTKRGFTLVRRRSEAGRGNEATGEFTPLSQVFARDEAMMQTMKEKKLPMEPVLDIPEEIEIGWHEVVGVWVPKSYKLVATMLRKNDSKEPGEIPVKVVRRETTLTFDWTSVNRQLTDDLFDYHSFDLPKGTDVFDDRGAKSVFVERIGSEAVSRKVDLKPKRHRIVLVVVNLLAIGMMVGYVLYRQYRKAGGTQGHT